MGSTEWTPRYELQDGTEVTGDDINKLWQVPGGGWAHPSPVACPKGHLLQHPNVLVGHQPCIVVPHRTHECETCHYVVLTPPKQPGCTHGPEEED